MNIFMKSITIIYYIASYEIDRKDKKYLKYEF